MIDLTHPETNRRRAIAYEMRAKGLSWREIGEALGITKCAAHRLLYRQPVTGPRLPEVPHNERDLYPGDVLKPSVDFPAGVRFDDEPTSRKPAAGALPHRIAGPAWRQSSIADLG
jgi:hypothetical protein